MIKDSGGGRTVGGITSPPLSRVAPSHSPCLSCGAEGSPLFLHSCALFCTFLHFPETQLFSFQAVPHSLHKTPGVGDHFSRAEDFPRGNSMGSAGGLSAISSSCGYCWRSGSGTFPL